MPVKPGVPVEPELEHRQAGLRRDRQAHRVGHFELPGADELLLGEKQQAELPHFRRLSGMKRSRLVACCQSASSMRCLRSTRLRRQSVSQPMPVKYRMVSVVQLHPLSGAAALEPLGGGLPPAERALIARALEFAEPLYAGQVLSTGEPVWAHALGLAGNLAADRRRRDRRAPRACCSPRRNISADPKGLQPAVRRGDRRARDRRGEALPAAPGDARHAERAERDPAQDGARHGRGRARGADPPGEPHADAALVREESIRRKRLRTRARRWTSTRRSPTGSACGS